MPSFSTTCVKRTGFSRQARKARRRPGPRSFPAAGAWHQTHPPAHPPPARPAHRTGTCTGLPWKVQRRAFRRPPAAVPHGTPPPCACRTGIRPLHTARGSPPAPARHRHSRRQRSPGWRKALRRARCNAHAPASSRIHPATAAASCVTWYKRRSRFEDTRMSMDGEDVL